MAGGQRSDGETIHASTAVLRTSGPEFEPRKGRPDAQPTAKAVGRSDA